MRATRELRRKLGETYPGTSVRVIPCTGNMSNATFVLPDLINYDLLIDDNLQAITSTLGVIILIFNGISLVALNRTRQTPQTARFLSSALLVFDFLTTFFFQVRKFAVTFQYSLMLQFIGNGWSFLAYVDVAIMSIERLIIFQWPNFYLRRVSFRAFRNASLILWILYLGSWTSGIGYCLFSNGDNDRAMGECSDVVMTFYVLLTCPVSTILSAICFVKIVSIIRKQTSKVMGKRKSFKNHKSTIVVFMCLTNYIVTSICYAIIMFVTINDNVQRRIFMDLLMMVNGLMDTCVYVLWYKECRLELLKMGATLFPSLNTRIEAMRRSVFDVMSYGSSTATTDVS